LLDVKGSDPVNDRPKKKPRLWDAGAASGDEFWRFDKNNLAVRIRLSKQNPKEGLPSGFAGYMKVTVAA
jgi:hypothetical protein